MHEGKQCTKWMCESRLRCQTDSVSAERSSPVAVWGETFFSKLKKKKKKSFFTRQKHRFSFLKRVSQPLLAARHLIQFHKAEHAGNSDATSGRFNNTNLSVRGAEDSLRAERWRGQAAMTAQEVTALCATPVSQPVQVSVRMHFWYFCTFFLEGRWKITYCSERRQTAAMSVRNTIYEAQLCANTISLEQKKHHRTLGFLFQCRRLEMIKAVCVCALLSKASARPQSSLLHTHKVSRFFFLLLLRDTSERGHGDAARTRHTHTRACSIYSVTRFIDLKSSIISHQTCNVFSNLNPHLHLHLACWIHRPQLHNPFSEAVFNPSSQAACSNIFCFLCWIHVLTPGKFLDEHLHFLTRWTPELIFCKKSFPLTLVLFPLHLFSYIILRRWLQVLLINARVSLEVTLMMNYWDKSWAIYRLKLSLHPPPPPAYRISSACWKKKKKEGDNKPILLSYLTAHSLLFPPTFRVGV